MVEIKRNCFYWINGSKVTNYLQKQITKKRPAFCFLIKRVNGINYYYFVLGTSKAKNEVRVQNFTNYFVNIQPSQINNLEMQTNFQTNTIYIIPEDDLNIFFDEEHSYFIGKSTTNEIKLIINQIDNSYSDGVHALSFFSNEYLKWLFIDNGKNFLYIASRHHKTLTKNVLKTTIKKYSKESRTLINNLNKNDYFINKLRISIIDLE